MLRKRFRSSDIALYYRYCVENSDNIEKIIRNQLTKNVFRAKTEIILLKCYYLLVEDSLGYLVWLNKLGTRFQISEASSLYGIVRFQSALPETTRDRPKSAPYQRFKNCKRTSKCQNICELGPFDYFFQNAEKKLILNIDSLAKLPKLEGGPFGIIFSKMSHNAKKILEGPLVSTGIVSYTEKKKKTFWFRILGKQVQFGDTLKFCSFW